MNHNANISVDERLTYGDWGDTSISRKEAFIRECDEFYFTTSELMAFVEMLRDRQIDIMFRIWRKDNELVPISKIPEIMDNEPRIVFDLCHSGEDDTENAHWELLWFSPDFQSPKQR